MQSFTELGHPNRLGTRPRQMDQARAAELPTVAYEVILYSWPAAPTVNRSSTPSTALVAVGVMAIGHALGGACEGVHGDGAVGMRNGPAAACLREPGPGGGLRKSARRRQPPKRAGVTAHASHALAA